MNVMQSKFAQQTDLHSWMELVSLVEDNFPGLIIDEYKQYLIQRIKDKSAVTIKNDDIVIGALTFSKENKEIEFLAVHPDYRKQGIAANMVKFMIAQFEKGTEIFVVTYRNDDLKGKSARRFYKKMGFSEGEYLTLFDYSCQKLLYTTK